jgi:hypothetical protein
MARRDSRRIKTPPAGRPSPKLEVNSFFSRSRRSSAKQQSGAPAVMAAGEKRDRRRKLLTRSRPRSLSPSFLLFNSQCRLTSSAAVARGGSEEDGAAAGPLAGARAPPVGRAQLHRAATHRCPMRSRARVRRWLDCSSSSPSCCEPAERRRGRLLVPRRCGLQWRSPGRTLSLVLSFLEG